MYLFKRFKILPLATEIVVVVVVVVAVVVVVVVVVVITCGQHGGCSDYIYEVKLCLYLIR
jgi:hypothetical protein